MPPAYASFTVAEHRERLGRARDALGAAGFDYCVSFAPETHYYLAGYDTWVGVNSPQALIFSVAGDEDPSLLVRNVDTLLATETSWLNDIQSYHLFAEDFAALAAGIAREHGFGGGRIAIELQSYALSVALFHGLQRAFAPAEFADATGLLGDLRILKSPTEMKYIREAAGYANLGLTAARDALRSGMMEIDLAHAVESAMRGAGSDYWSIPTELASGTRTPGGHATPREKIIAPGDLVHLEFAGVARRYHATAAHTLACGEPGKRQRELYDIARESLAAGIARCTAGTCVAEIEEASLEPLRAHGLDGSANMRFGYGIGLAYPPIWLETLTISRGFDTRLAPGMVFVLHAFIQRDGEGIGIVQGGTYALTGDGLEELVGGGDVPFDVR